jgi:hypothetical protein
LSPKGNLPEAFDIVESDRAQMILGYTWNYFNANEMRLSESGKNFKHWMQIDSINVKENQRSKHIFKHGLTAVIYTDIILKLGL